MVVVQGWAAAADRGGRAHMEDRHAVVPALGLAAVFDGHNGWQVADHCARHAGAAVQGVLGPGAPPSGEGGLQREGSWEEGRSCRVRDVPRKMEQVFLALDAGAAAQGCPRDAGCTACLLLVSASGVFAANAGDSRAILKTGGQVVALTRDHKPESADERARIQAAGGWVAWDGHCHRVNGSLNLSRSLGDWHLRPAMTPSPEVRFWQRREGDQYVLVASDGLWDALSNEKAAAVVDAHLDPRARGHNTGLSYRGAGPHEGQGQALRLQRAADDLVRQARARGSTDNITVVVAGA
jgi:protein phosphatase 2C